MSDDHYRPSMTQAGLAPTHPVIAVDEFGERREVYVAGESPLSLYVDDREIVTLMTLGTQPEALAIGYLRNQRFIDKLEEIRDVSVDWRTESVRITTWDGVEGWDEKLKKRTVTTGCGQGTVFSCTLDALYHIKLPDQPVHQSLLYGLLENIRTHNEIYKRAGAVHGCGLCHGTDIIMFVEDVGRHNAADSIAAEEAEEEGKRFKMVIGMSLAYVTSFAGLILAWHSWRKHHGKEKTQ